MVKIVNFIKANTTNSTILVVLCEKMGAQHCHLLLHTDVHCLSSVKVVSRVYELSREIEAFLTKTKPNLAVHLQDDAWVAKVAYISDILGFNQLNLSMQGKMCDIFQASDKIIGFKKKLSVWKDCVSKGVYDMFPLFSSMESKVDLGLMDILMGAHLSQTLLKFKEYFPSQCDPNT